MSFVYLASPYEHETHRVREDRARLVVRHTAWAMENWQTTFSPIAHGHQLPLWMENAHVSDYQFWLHHDINMLEKADELHVLMIDGWETSKGCIMEVEFALAKLNIVVKGVELKQHPSGLVFIQAEDSQLVSIPDADPPIIKPASEKRLYLVT